VLHLSDLGESSQAVETARILGRRGEFSITPVQTGEFSDVAGEMVNLVLYGTISG